MSRIINHWIVIGLKKHQTDLLLESMATLRENPGLKVKLLVGPTFVKLPRSTQRSC